MAIIERVTPMPDPTDLDAVLDYSAGTFDRTQMSRIIRAEGGIFVRDPFEETAPDTSLPSSLTAIEAVINIGRIGRGLEPIDLIEETARRSAEYLR